MKGYQELDTATAALDAYKTYHGNQMRILTYCLAFTIPLVIMACAAAPAGPSAQEQRARAHAAYDELDGKPSPAASQEVEPTQSSEEVEAIHKLPANVPSPVLMAIPANSGKDLSPSEVVAHNPYAKAAMESINDLLTERGYDVRSLTAQDDMSNILQMQNDISGKENDLSYIASLYLGADVYVKFIVSIKDERVTVELSAHEASTGRQIGTASGSAKYKGDINETKLKKQIQGLIPDILSKLEGPIQSYWVNNWNKGAQYKLVMRIGERLWDSEGLQENCISALQGLFKSVKVNTMTQQTIDLVVYVDAAQYPDVTSVYSAIRNSLSSFAQVKKNTLVNKFIILDLE